MGSEKEPQDNRPLRVAKTFTPEPEVDMTDHHQHGDGYSADGSEYIRVRS
jgi:hypothetical protein